MDRFGLNFGTAVDTLGPSVFLEDELGATRAAMAVTGKTQDRSSAVMMLLDRNNHVLWEAPNCVCSRAIVTQTSAAIDAFEQSTRVSEPTKGANGKAAEARWLNAWGERVGRSRSFCVC